MSVSQALATFAGGVFLANAVPHYVEGMTGRPFHSPFADPPFRGLSSPVVNVGWALGNLAVSYLLAVVVGHLEPTHLASAAPAAVGFALGSLAVCRSVGRTRAANAPRPHRPV